MDYSALTFEEHERHAHISLNRPEVGNALNDVMIKDLMQAMLRCDEDPNIRAVLLSGAGKTFCVGGDLNNFAEHITDLPRHIKDIVIHLHGAISRMTRMDAPVIAAVHGNIAGAGISIAAAADITLAAESSTFYLAYTAIGLSPDGSSTYFLPRLVGLKRALDLTLTNRRFSAHEALDWGLVSRVVPDDDLMGEAHSLAASLSEGPTLALGAAKRLMRNGWNETLETQMEYEGQSIADMARSKDLFEGISAFMEKRKPDFKGE